MLDEWPAEQKITDFEEGPRATLRLTRQSGPIVAKGVIDAIRVGRTCTTAWIGGAVLGARATYRRPCGGGRSAW
jgi:hypothetical protein